MELDLDLTGPLDHVIIRNDVALFVVDDAGAQAVAGPLLRDALEEALEELPPGVLLAARQAAPGAADHLLEDLRGGDVDDRWLLGLGDVDEGLGAELRSVDRTKPDQNQGRRDERM